jgi:hypothetical protein
MTNKKEYKQKIQKKKQKHNYTSELELKSLLIRIINQRSNIGTIRLNNRINKYINLYTKLNLIKYKSQIKTSQKNRIKTKLKSSIIHDSENTYIDEASYERFGEIILLMIKNILTKPQFSGYTYKDEFYSDAVYKILKYLNNFNHKMISQRTGSLVNSFAYISQYIHNSILFIINTKKKEQERFKDQVDMAYLNHSITLKIPDLNQSPTEEQYKETKIKTVTLYEIDNLIDEIKKNSQDIDNFDRINIYYPKKYKITFDDYNKLKLLLKNKISIMRMR